MRNTGRGSERVSPLGRNLQRSQRNGDLAWRAAAFKDCSGPGRDEAFDSPFGQPSPSCAAMSSVAHDPICSRGGMPCAVPASIVATGLRMTARHGCSRPRLTS